jgi:hypothetical protein
LRGAFLVFASQRTIARSSPIELATDGRNSITGWPPRSNDRESLTGRITRRILSDVNAQIRFPVTFMQSA